MAHLRPFPKVVTNPALIGLLACCLLRAQAPAPDLGGAAKLLSFTGQISYMRDSTPWVLNIGDVVQPQQVIVTGPDGWGVFQVSDGSKFEVFPNSKVVFRANRSDWKEILEVWLGKVRVQIEHFGTVPNHNQVRTPSAVISVRGTVFDVTVDDVTDTTLVVDEEGSVGVRHLLRPGPDRVLSEGESVLIYKNEPLGKAQFDRGGWIQRAARVASDAFYQVAMNSQKATGTVAKVPATTTSADKNNTTPPPPGPPPPPPAPTGPPH